MNPFEYIKDKLFGIEDLNISEDEKIEKIVLLLFLRLYKHIWVQELQK